MRPPLKFLQKRVSRCRHRGARKMLLDAGCSISRHGRIRMPAHLAEDALKTAPKRIRLYDQGGNEAMDLVDENWYYGTGSDTIFTIDIDSGQRRRTTIEDTANFARLVDGLENMDFAMSMSNPEDVPIDDIYVHVFAEMIKNTNKPLIFIADSGEDIAKMYDIACLVAGGEKELQAKALPVELFRSHQPPGIPGKCHRKAHVLRPEENTHLPAFGLQCRRRRTGHTCRRPGARHCRESGRTRRAPAGRQRIALSFRTQCQCVWICGPPSFPMAAPNGV